MRFVTHHPDEAGDGLTSLRPLRKSEGATGELAQWMQSEVEDALSARSEMEREWRDALRRYEGVPRTRLRDSPVENAPNIEVALGAIASDSIYAQLISTIFETTPIVTARASGSAPLAQKQAAALQRRLDHGVTSEWNFRAAAETAGLDFCQLGTSVVRTQWVEQVRKTDLHVVKETGARIEAWPIEDVIVPGGARTDLQRLPWVAFRAWYTPGELAMIAKRSGWSTDAFRVTGTVEWVRSQRENLGRHRQIKTVTSLYEVLHVYAHFDYDDDGEDEDLYFVFDRGSSSIGYLRYNPYDTRDAEVGRYNLRAHLFYGQGVLEMTRTQQETVTELMNAALLNVQLSNIPVIAVGRNVDDQQKLWVGKLIPVDDPDKGFVPKQLAQVNPATAQYIAMNMSLAERRVGVNDMAMPRPSQVLGSRTPGITAMSMLQQVNKRFTPAFDQFKLMLAGAVKQCLYREQERLLAGDVELEDYLRRLLGPEEGQLVIDLLRDPTFDEQMVVELTASSASVNREADRQSAILLVNILGQYYGKALELVQIAANPGLPQPIRDVAHKIANAANAIIERTIRTFDIARDPKTFVIEMDAEMDQLAMDAQEMQAMQGLMGMIGGPAPAGPDGGGDGMGGPPPVAEAA